MLPEDIVFMPPLTVCISGAWQLPRHNQDGSPPMMTSKNYKWQQREGLAGTRFIISYTARRSEISWTSETGVSGATNSLLNLSRLHLFWQFACSRVQRSLRHHEPWIGFETSFKLQSSKQTNLLQHLLWWIERERYLMKKVKSSKVVRLWAVQEVRN